MVTEQGHIFRYFGFSFWHPEDKKPGTLRWKPRSPESNISLEWGYGHTFRLVRDSTFRQS
jgi:hypothetical protein